MRPSSGFNTFRTLNKIQYKLYNKKLQNLYNVLFSHSLSTLFPAIFWPCSLLQGMFHIFVINSCCYFNNFVHNFICVVVSCNTYKNNNADRAALCGTTCVANLVPVVLHLFITSCQPTFVGLNIYARSCPWQVTNVMCVTTLFLINPFLNITYYCHYTLTDIFRPTVLFLQNAWSHFTECR
jgi:hypothetical protein